MPAITPKLAATSQQNVLAATPILRRPAVQLIAVRQSYWFGEREGGRTGS